MTIDLLILPYYNGTIINHEGKTIMKKLIAIIAILALAITMFASCTQATNPDSADYDKLLKEIKATNTGANGTLTVSISPDFAPMEFCDVSKTGQDTYVGFDVLLANYIAAELDMKLEIKPLDFNACQAAVETKSVDMSISGYSYTETRAANFLLSDVYYTGESDSAQAIITTKANEGKFTKAADFSGLTIGAQTASLQYNLCTSQLPADCTIKEFVSIDTAVESLIAGKIDALAVAEGNGDVIINNNSTKLAFSGFLFEITSDMENNLILLNKDSAELCEKVNAALAKALAAGYYPIWNAAAEKYAGSSNAAEIGYDESGNKVEKVEG